MRDIWLTLLSFSTFALVSTEILESVVSVIVITALTMLLVVVIFAEAAAVAVAKPAAVRVASFTV